MGGRVRGGAANVDRLVRVRVSVMVRDRVRVS